MQISNEQLRNLSQEFSLSEGEEAYLIKFLHKCREFQEDCLNLESERSQHLLAIAKTIDKILCQELNQILGGVSRAPRILSVEPPHFYHPTCRSNRFYNANPKPSQSLNTGNSSTIGLGQYRVYG